MDVRNYISLQLVALLEIGSTATDKQQRLFFCYLRRWWWS